MNDFQEMANQVWSATDVNLKRELLMQMVGQFKFKSKQVEFKAKILKIRTAADLDKLAANLAINHTDAVVGLIPR
jgi:hypothetical protein